MFPYKVTNIVHVVLFHHTLTEECVFVIKGNQKRIQINGQFCNVMSMGIQLHSWWWLVHLLITGFSLSAISLDFVPNMETLYPQKLIVIPSSVYAMAIV